ncbi:hypothetical protein AVEN_234106-1 [Araneus ventricosus]|uniref:Integrase p58-like C-terminal domain-containing protein n=1 Tax=Araneus ventricosus TaxID=182803 RepID=A0A4Y2GLS7_ARAVE|nr:hypothetical protein AVEN_234106-1 [Araneus ventricosus]
MATTSTTVEFISLTTTVNGVVTEADKREDTTTTSTAVECTSFEESEVIKLSSNLASSDCKHGKKEMFNAIVTVFSYEKWDFSKSSFGSYRITRRLSDVTYEVQSIEVNSRRQSKKYIVHVLRLKPYCDPQKQLDDAGAHRIPRRPVIRSQTRLQRDADSS